MRRLLAILLLAAFGLPAAASALAFGPSADTHLPACCRRTGTHHCSGSMAPSTHSPAISGTCPSYTQQAATTPATPHTLLTAGIIVSTQGIATAATTHRTYTQHPATSNEANPKRGPPTELL